jgi:hypothetical protein
MKSTLNEIIKRNEDYGFFHYILGYFDHREGMRAYALKTILLLGDFLD